MRLTNQRSTVVVGTCLALALILLLYGVARLWGLRAGYVDQIESITPRTARLLGLAQSEDQLSIDSRMASLTLSGLAYSGQRDGAATATEMQQEIRELMTNAGLSISGSQILPRQQDQGMDRLALDVTAEGNIDALEQALQDLEILRPIVVVKSLLLKPTRVSRRSRRKAGAEVLEDTRRVTARFQLVALRISAS